jgi:hypothetical protein
VVVVVVSTPAPAGTWVPAGTHAPTAGTGEEQFPEAEHVTPRETGATKRPQSPAQCVREKPNRASLSLKCFLRSRRAPSASGQGSLVIQIEWPCKSTCIGHIRSSSPAPTQKLGGVPVFRTMICSVGIKSDQEYVCCRLILPKQILESLSIQLALVKTAGFDPAYKEAGCGRCSPLIWVRCMMRREPASNGSRRCIVQRLSHSSRSPTRHACSQENSGRDT